MSKDTKHPDDVESRYIPLRVAQVNKDHPVIQRINNREGLEQRFKLNGVTIYEWQEGMPTLQEALEELRERDKDDG